MDGDRPGAIGMSNVAGPPTPTLRQLEVLRARCETGSRKEAAAALRISPETVRWHLARLFERCGCVDDAQAAYRHRDELDGLVA